MQTQLDRKVDGYRFFKIVPSEGLFQKLYFMKDRSLFAESISLVRNAPSYLTESTLTLDNGHLPSVIHNTALELGCELTNETTLPGLLYQNPC
jgi:hypothetical protein